jgi:hypothetical protein
MERDTGARRTNGLRRMEGIFVGGVNMMYDIFLVKHEKE